MANLKSSKINLVDISSLKSGNTINLKTSADYADKYNQYTKDNFIVSITAASASLSSSKTAMGQDPNPGGQYNGSRHVAVGGGGMSVTTPSWSYDSTTGILTFTPGTATLSATSGYTEFSVWGGDTFSSGTATAPAKSGAISYTYKVMLIDCPADYIEKI